jgi:hypothetical protein
VACGCLSILDRASAAYCDGVHVGIAFSIRFERIVVAIEKDGDAGKQAGYMLMPSRASARMITKRSQYSRSGRLRGRGCSACPIFCSSPGFMKKNKAGAETKLSKQASPRKKGTKKPSGPGRNPATDYESGWQE